MRKADGDESILDGLLEDSDVPDDVLGLHAYQAIEKRLKAVLAFNEIDYDRTHSIGYLTSFWRITGSIFSRAANRLREHLDDLEVLVPAAPPLRLGPGRPNCAAHTARI